MLEEKKSSCVEKCVSGDNINYLMDKWKKKKILLMDISLREKPTMDGIKVPGLDQCRRRLLRIPVSNLEL